MPDPTGTRPDLIERLRVAIFQALRPLVPPDLPVALLDFPAYANVGDSMIWLGEIGTLAALGMPRAAYTSDMRTFDPAHLRSLLGADGVILLSGGGNFGDLWPAHQTFREHVIAGFPDHRIVQLPQSIHFADAAGLGRTRRVVTGHDRFTLMVRDGQSLDVARDGLGIDAVLCPDMAFAIGPLNREQPAHDARTFVWLLRTDAESAAHAPSPHSARSVDWNREPPSGIAGLTDRVSHVARRRPMLGRVLRGAISARYEALATARLRRGRDLLSSASGVVTDRLHGHVLCMLLGIPHVLVADRTGKGHASHETWTSESGLVAAVNSLDDAPGALRSLGVATS